MHGFDLALEVVFLLARGDSAVDCALGRLFLGNDLVVLKVLSAVGRLNGLTECGGVESPLSTWSELEVDELVVGPGAESASADSKGFSGNTGTNQLRGG